MQHKVDTLRLTVHSPPGREAETAQLAERFTCQVLEQFGQMMEARAPGRVVLIHRLALHWSLSEAELANPAEVASRAADLANTVAAQRGVHTTDGMALFPDEAEWLVFYLRERAAGSGEHWFHAAWRDAERHVSGGAPLLRRETVLMALSRLHATGELARVLVGLPRPTIAALARALGHGNAVVPRSDNAAALQRSEHLGQHRTPVADHNLVDSPRLVSAQMNVAHVESALIATVAALVDGGGQPILLASTSSAKSYDVISPTTRFGGLFYLLSLALELGIGDALWKVCLPEGLVLAHAATVLIGSDAADDSAPALFGGVAADELLEWPAISPAQQAEVCIELLAATARALCRYDLAPSPEVFLDVVPSCAGRMLVAFGQGPFVLFAWPAEDARATAAGIGAFLSVWPVAFPAPHARNALVNLDNTGRLRAIASKGQPTLFLPSVPSAQTSAVLAQICGAMAELFVLRAGCASTGASELLSRYLAIPGRIELAPEAMTLVLPMASIDLAVRRAALDRDPGWTPWLKRTVRIEFLDVGSGD